MIAVIGGGAAGMMAALAAREKGENVTLIEKNASLGRKLRITGKGRCNITNMCPTEDIFENVINNPRFLYSAIYNFTNYDTVSFFESLGVKTKVERGMRVFPESDRAADVVSALSEKIRKSGIAVINGAAREIITKNGYVTAVALDGRTVACDAVILATGGKSYPKTGSDGSGYELVRAVGHNITELRASLVPLETEQSTHSLMGLSLKNAAITVFDRNGKKVYTDFGEMMFTHFGVTGPMILSASCHIKDDPCGAVISIDLKPALDRKKLDTRIMRDFLKYSNRNFENALCDLLPGKMTGCVVHRSGIDPYKKVNAITKEERTRLCDVIKNLRFTVKRARDVDEAIVTSGGADVRQINASTMESKIVRGLFFAGEIIDIDAYTGGFNLQLAFSTGRLAGEKAAERGMNYGNSD